MDLFPLVTHSRIVVPRRRDEILTRMRLVNGLMALLDKRLVIVSAPAGYGKTSLLVDFIQRLEWPACWYAVSDLDGEPLRFIAHFIAALQERFPQFGLTAMGILRTSGQERINIDLLVSAVANEIYEHIPEHFILVLDDYHLVDESHPVNQFISRLLQVVSENCHVFVASRTLLTLPDLPLLVARNEVGGMSIDELSFLPEEIQALFLQNQRQVLGTEQARELAEKTEGWIAGLLLSGPLANGAASIHQSALKASGVGLDTYLAQQVLEKQPEAIRAFLLRTSLLEEFNAAFCAEVIGPALNLELDWAALMETAQRSNLFILPIDEEWLRYHHLFLAFLQRRMAAQHSDEARSIQMRLAQVYAGRGDWERAYRVYGRLGQLSSQAGLLEQAGPDLMTSGRLATLASWLADMSEEMRLAHPVLLSLQGGVAIMRGDLADAETLLERAISGLRAGGDNFQLALALSRRSAGRRLGGHFDDSLADAEEALAIAEKLPTLTRVQAEAHRARGTALLSVGEIRPAFEQLTQAHASYQALGDTASAARILLEIGMARRRLGQLDAAETAYTQALELWETTHNLAWQANLLNNLGVLQHERGDYLEAAHSLERAVECARLAGYPRMEAFALAGLGDLYRDLKAFHESEVAYRQAASLAGRVDERGLLLYLEIARSVLARRQQQLSSAREYLAEAARLLEKGASEVDRDTYYLEAAALKLLSGEPQEAIAQLDQIVTFYAQHGMRVEAARCFLTMMAAAGPANAGAAREYAQKYLDIWDLPAAWPPLVTVARELKPWLEQAQAQAELAALAGRLLRQVAALDRKLPGLRRQLRPQAAVVPIGPAHVLIHALGRLEVRINDHFVSSSDWRSAAARELFFFLLVHPLGLSKEQIGLVLWPDASLDQLQQRFRNLIYRLRHAVGSDVVVLGAAETYQFNGALDYEYDVETLLRELELAQRKDKPETRFNHMLKAIKLYHGDYLPEIDAEWALVERENLKRRYLAGLVEIANLALELKRSEQSLQFCLRALQVDPSMEEIHRLAMRAYGQAGDRAAVIRQYLACSQLMREDFGTEPSPQTTALYQELTR
jgi:LuxR family transcriptional regulator, maltose regulon positive regulatory protein